MRLIIPEMKRYPPGADLATRTKMFEEYKAELARLNPGLVHTDGTPRSLWGCLAYLFRSKAG
jgi:hypothetical protein